MKNIEIKAKATNIPALFKKAQILSGTNEPTILIQHDTFYNVPNGRLKLRRITAENDTAELIFYNRSNQIGPKLCCFDTSVIEPNSTNQLNTVLTKALGAKVDVKKKRSLFLIDQTRVHIDEVEGLGSFVELEVCLKDNQTEKEGEEIANELMEKLGIEKKDLISGAYADLLLNPPSQIN